MGSIRCSDTIYKLSAGRRTIVLQPANDRSPPDGQHLKASISPKRIGRTGLKNKDGRNKVQRGCLESAGY
ncbi:hypothetical protein [Parabacteroides johnsonii]|uniref:hypothetical protein n=1 Tax=Parabacteroides johnsonii TaxID=387661 RepID=UPI00117C0A62|nr:hypothetical protein [Parabacteroides johnsonii]